MIIEAVGVEVEVVDGYPAGVDLRELERKGSGRRDDGLMRPDPDDLPTLRAQSEDETGIGWGEAPEEDDNERLHRERPPHWDHDGE